MCKIFQLVEAPNITKISIQCWSTSQLWNWNRTFKIISNNTYKTLKNKKQNLAFFMVCAIVLLEWNTILNNIQETFLPKEINIESNGMHA